MIVYAVISDEEYGDLVTSYQFISNVHFTSTEQVKMCIEYCKEKERLSEDTLNYLLEKITLLSTHVEVGKSNEAGEAIGALLN